MFATPLCLYALLCNMPVYKESDSFVQSVAYGIQQNKVLYFNLSSHSVLTFIHSLDWSYNQIGATFELDWPVGRLQSAAQSWQIGLRLHWRFLLLDIARQTALVKTNDRDPQNSITLVAAVGSIWWHLQTVNGDVCDRQTGQYHGFSKCETLSNLHE